MKRAYMPSIVFLLLSVITIVLRAIISSRVKNGIFTGQVKKLDFYSLKIQLIVTEQG